jgi:hypothetical protein
MVLSRKQTLLPKSEIEAHWDNETAFAKSKEIVYLNSIM